MEWYHDHAYVSSLSMHTFSTSSTKKCRSCVFCEQQKDPEDVFDVADSNLLSARTPRIAGLYVEVMKCFKRPSLSISNSA